jgi:NADPH2:quinone reductase
MIISAAYAPPVPRMASMRAVWQHKFGGPQVLVAGEAPDPVPGPGQALIEVAFASITFIETMTRAGSGPFTVQLPMIPGNGVGGVAAGTRVVSSTGGSGGYAERAAVDAAGMVAVPDGLALDDAVALLADGRTAVGLIEAAALQPGDRVLVEAAAGGVGTLLVQLARSANAHVVAAAGGERKLLLALELGADEAVDYTTPVWTAGLEPVDVVFDSVGGEIGRAAFELLARGGRMVSFGLSSGSWTTVSEEEAAERGLTLVTPSRPTAAEQRTRTERALAEAAAGRLRPVIGQRFALERAADAHAAIESRATVGKTLLVV